VNQINLVKPLHLSGRQAINTLVEHRRAYTLDNCELNVFETYAASELVPLTFNELVITSMLRGKKIMHLFDKPGFDYLPGQTVIVPPGVTMRIDFPEASLDNPSQCTALAIDQRAITRTLDFLNEHHARTDQQTWGLNYRQFHFSNNEEFAELVNKLIRISTGDELTKDVLADLTLKELLIRIMQIQNFGELKTGMLKLSGNHRFAFIVEYIRIHLTEKLTIDLLSNLAYMSRASFFRAFKAELGISPVDYIIRERLALAKQLMTNPCLSISETAFRSGFQNLNYFCRAFRKFEGNTPGWYRVELARARSAGGRMN